MKKDFARTILSASVALALALPAHAALERMGPINSAPSVGGFPSFFQDSTGLALEFCDPRNQAELDGGWCVLIPPGPVYPESFPTNFFPEHFYFDANASLKTGTMKANLIIAVEAAFANNQPAAGDQMTFGRIRVFITNVPASGTYTVYHPFGKWIFPNVAAGDRIFFTEDIGIACVNTFSCTLGTSIGPFMLPSPVRDGAERPPIPDLQPGQDPIHDALVAAGAATPYPNTGKKYLADPARLGPVTGSPLPPFVGNDGVTYNHNVFRVEGPNGLVLHSTNFNVAGRVMTGAMPGKVTVDRATYKTPVTTPAGASVTKLDVFATGLSASQGRVPALPAPPAVTPILTYFEAPCAGTVDPNTGAVLPPYSAPIGVTEVQMVAADTKYWGQSQPATVPPAVCVEDSTARNAAGQVVPMFFNVPVTDEVTQASGSGATYDSANGGTLTVTAKSSDSAVPPVLTVAGYGAMTNGTLSVTPLLAPPSKVTVLSSEGGTADMLVQTALGAPGNGPAPLALNDDYSMNEDCSATPATSCAAPLVMNPLANDTLNGQALPAGTTIAITAQPRFGTVVVNADQTLTYTPNANANGAEGIGYTVTANGLTSNVAYITINVAPVNDIPVAVNDAAGAVLGVANSVNVIANDTDIDGVADLANAQIVTWPPELGPQPVPASGVVTFTPAAAGTFTFTYGAVDRAGAVSANVANVVVTVAAGESITIGKSNYKVGNQGGGASARWTVDGTDSIRQGQTLTVTYKNGTLSAAQGGGTCDGTATLPKCVIGTTVVDALGNYLFDKVTTPGGASDPTDATAWTTKPTQIQVYSSSPVLGGFNSKNIVLK